MGKSELLDNVFSDGWRPSETFKTDCAREGTVDLCCGFDGLDVESPPIYQLFQVGNT